MTRASKRLAGLTLLLLLTLPAAGSGETAPAAGGHRLLEGAAAAPLTVVGLIEDPSQIDTYGWRARLRVERVLDGEANPGDLLVIAWEEFIPKRPPRFPAGKRSVLALEPLPSGSLWRQRFPARKALAVAVRGEAYLSNPGTATLDALEQYLRLASEDRRARSGIAALSALAALAEPRVAAAAIDALEHIPGLETRLDEESTSHLEALLQDTSRPVDLRGRLITLAGERPLPSLESALSSLATSPSPVQGPAVASLARLREGLSVEQTAALLDSDDSLVRAAAARWGGAGIAETRLKQLVAKDPAGEVRAAALVVLFERNGMTALELALPAFADTDARVRGAAIEGVAKLGDPVVPILRELVWNPDADPASLTTPLMTLALTGPEGVAELHRIASEHPTKKLRKLARFVLGKDPGHD
ncbi:MAG: HEAT repeat domain-containing protein [bacterium]|nr:HEAT repeat domain-containing protein [bacterium]